MITKRENVGGKTITVFSLSKGHYGIRLRLTVQGFPCRTIYPKMKTHSFGIYPGIGRGLVCQLFLLTD